MPHEEPQFLDIGDDSEKRRIAVVGASVLGAKTNVFWLSGFKSDMASTKATALAEWAAGQGLGITRFDYSGHGISEGRFEDGTISLWLEEAVAVFRRATGGRQIVVGSSMGGYLALLLLRRLLSEAPNDAARIAGLVLLAPAWDMTEGLIWARASPDQRAQLLRDGVYPRASDYGEPYPITRALIEDGRRHLLGGRRFDPGRPVRIIQGAQDVDVPLAHAEELVTMLEGGWTSLAIVPDGEHRLSRPQDLELLYRTVSNLAPS